MTNGLLAAADVHKGDGNWTAGLESEAVQSGLSSAIADVCLPSPAGIMSGTGGGQPSGYRLKPFGFVVRLKEPTMCKMTDPITLVDESIAAETEKVVGSVFWNGSGISEMWLGATDVRSVVPGATALDTIGLLLAAFYRGTVGIDPIVHIGVAAALKLGDALDPGTSTLRAIDLPVVVSPGYPAGGIAVTGPVEVWVSDVQTIEAVAWRNNRRYVEASRIAAVSFDPAAAFVAGEPPVQIYISNNGGPLGITVYALGNELAAAVDWGDATGDGSYTPGLASLGHTYAAAGTYAVAVTHNGAVRTVTVTV